VSQYDPNLDPARPLPGEPVYTETVIVRRESNTGWWIAGGLAAIILVAVIWILSARAQTPPVDDTEARLAEAQAAQAVAEAQASSNVAAVQGQIAGGQQSLELARADAARAQADAQRADSEARAAEARAAVPAVVTAPSNPPSNGVSVITPTSPQP
jgi:hypothetical protein